MLYKLSQYKLKEISKRISEDYVNGRYLPFSFIKSKLQNKSAFFLATGGSAIKYLDQELDKKLVFTQNAAPYYLIKNFNIKPNFWILKNQDSIKMFLRLSGVFKLDYSNIILLVPSLQSYSKVNISHPLLQRLIFKIPNLKYSTFDEIYQPYITYNELNYFAHFHDKSILRYPNGSSLEALFIPLALSLGIKKMFFSGVDQLSTGHFWDKNEYYQDINGKKLKFVNHDIVINNTKAIYEIVKDNIEILRCADDSETIFKMFKKVLKNRLIEELDSKIIF